METDYRQGQKIIATFTIEDKGHDFIELDVLDNGVLVGDNVMFKNGRLSLLGLGRLDGMEYHPWTEIKKANGRKSYKGLLVDMFETGGRAPLPWKAQTLRYVISGRKTVTNANRFISKK